jgi:hypothetical protein
MTGNSSTVNYEAAALADVPNRCAVHGANPIGEVAVVPDN